MPGWTLFHTASIVTQSSIQDDQRRAAAFAVDAYETPPDIHQFVDGPIDFALAVAKASERHRRPKGRPVVTSGAGVSAKGLSGAVTGGQRGPARESQRRQEQERMASDLHLSRT